MAKLIFGCGYLGLRVAQRWLAAGETVHALTRKPARANEFERLGIKPIMADVAEPSSLVGHLPECETVLYAIGYDASAGPSREQVQIAGLQSALEALPSSTGRIVFISTTGVYGQMTGEWIDEDSPCEPTREAGRAALAAERILQTSTFGPRSIVLRLAGIYGPGRLPHRRDLAAGKPVAAAPDSYLNLIHVDDAVTAILAAESLAQPPRMFLVSDGHPVRRAEFLGVLTRLIGASPPQFETPPTEVLAAIRSGSDKRISNARLVRELHFAPKYPTYREGLASIVSESNDTQA